MTTLSAPLPCPESTFTKPAWAVRLAATHSLSIAGLATARATAVPMALLTPLAIGPWKFLSRADSRGRWALASSADAFAVSAVTSTLLVIWAVILSLSAACMDGSVISGAMFATYRSVLTPGCGPHATTDTVMNTQARTISTADTGARHRPPTGRAFWRAPGPVPGGCARACSRSSLTSARSRTSSSCSSSPADSGFLAPGTSWPGSAAAVSPVAGACAPGSV